MQVSKTLQDKLAGIGPKYRSLPYFSCSGLPSVSRADDCPTTGHRTVGELMNKMTPISLLVRPTPTSLMTAGSRRVSLDAQAGRHDLPRC